MRWNCPHCGVNLAVSDDKLGTGWSFSRCYKCGGFALIRRAEVNLVKVDRAPAGEHIVLPEASEEPYAMLSEEASENLNRIRRESAIRAAARAAVAVPPLPAQAPAMNPAALSALPNPLPERPARMSIFQRILPTAISFAAITTVTSGIYLYLQGQALWEKTRTAPPQPAEQVSAPQAAPQIRPVALRAESSDHVRQNAMAPVREESPAEDAATEAGSPEAPAPAPAAAPAASEPTETQRPSAVLVVQPRGKNADLHTGPGSLYPLIGMADPKLPLNVTDWSDRWFKVELPAKSGQKDGQKFGWIRTDLVQVVQTAQAPTAQQQ